ncbi:hypothetical protein PIB30_041774 [Stylosanthes scabra]|uniref:Uncharacterized protein n=1 Tax=Stylosanthes scabra TaxID=79078 RepID=A0ABU6UE93_9FABA|nr:hypothetical protein [Stylosanthes scabra]
MSLSQSLVTGTTAVSLESIAATITWSMSLPPMGMVVGVAIPPFLSVFQVKWLRICVAAVAAELELAATNVGAYGAYGCVAELVKRGTGNSDRNQGRILNP